MNVRKVLLGLAALFLVLSVLASAAPEPDQAKAPVNLPPGPAVVDPEPREPLGDAVRGTLPGDDVVRARVGQLVELTVTASSADSATIPGLGLSEALDADAPARFSFLAHRPGVFRVELGISGRVAGRVIVGR